MEVTGKVGMRDEGRVPILSRFKGNNIGRSVSKSDWMDYVVGGGKREGERKRRCKKVYRNELGSE